MPGRVNSSAMMFFLAIRWKTTFLNEIAEMRHDVLPSYDRTNRCFDIINREEESSNVSSVVSVRKPDYVEKMPFPPKEYVEKMSFKSLPPKGESKKSMKKKKKKRSKARGHGIFP
jgi:hypothetical protein